MRLKKDTHNTIIMDNNDTINNRKKQIDEFIGKNNTILNSLLDIDINENEISIDTRIILKKQILDFLKIMDQIGGDSSIEYIKSGATGHAFKLCDKNNCKYAIKFCPFPKFNNYGDIYDIKRPENAELKMIKVLSKFVLSKQTPHITLPIACFDTNISLFARDDMKTVADSSQYDKFIKRYKQNEFHETGTILISELANRGDLLDFLRKWYDDKNFTLDHWKSIFFQILSVLAVIQTKYPEFRHNDLKPDNILIHKTDNKQDFFTYRIARKKYKVKNINYQIRLWDFDFSGIPGIVDNNKIELQWTTDINITPVQNKYIDIHFFFIRLITLIPLGKSGNVPQEVKDFIKHILPDKYRNSPNVNNGGRLLVNDEYTTPQIILEEDSFFESYRVLSDDNERLEQQSICRSDCCEILSD
jgi:serine/threonine protein kinase